MKNNSNINSNNTIFIFIISLFIIIFIIISYFIFTNSIIDSSDSTDSTDSTNNNNNNKINNTSINMFSNKKDVFHIRDNVFSYNEAKAVCDAHDSKLATIEQMLDAWKKGANWCSYGWSEGQLALYPTQRDFWDQLQGDNLRKTECGEPGLNGGYFNNSNFKFGANCYGVRPPASGSDKVKNRRKTRTTHNKLVEKYDGKQYKISPFSNSNWR